MRRMKLSFLVGTALIVAGATSSASAADLALRPVTKAFAPVSHWAGFYASVSAGGTWTKATYDRTTNNQFTNIETEFCCGPGAVPESTDVENGTFTRGERNTGSDKGAVFTFTTGYNFVFNSWVLGAQSEVSYNLSKVFLQGSANNAQSSVEVFTCCFSGGSSSTSFNNRTDSFATTVDLRQNWTVSEMAKIGFLVTPELLLYGLVGWSWGGFEADFNEFSFTLNGFTYGGGIERDFGWFRGFIQVKQIDFRGKDLITSNNDVFTDSRTNDFTRTETTTGSNVRRLSANVTTVTAGITLPLNFWH